MYVMWVNKMGFFNFKDNKKKKHLKHKYVLTFNMSKKFFDYNFFFLVMKSLQIFWELVIFVIDLRKKIEN